MDENVTFVGAHETQPECLENDQVLHLKFFMFIVIVHIIVYNFNLKIKTFFFRKYLARRIEDHHVLVVRDVHDAVLLQKALACLWCTCALDASIENYLSCYEKCFLAPHVRPDHVVGRHVAQHDLLVPRLERIFEKKINK